VTTKSSITAVRSVDFGVPDLEAAARFYENIWGLKAVSSGPHSVYLRGTGPNYYILGLHQRPVAEMLRIDLKTGTKADVDALHASLSKANLTEIEAPAPITEPGGGYGFAFRDPEGRVMRILAGDATHADCADEQARPRKISHVVLNSPDRAGRFFLDHLGFKLSDQTGRITFFRCSSDHPRTDHHSIALFLSDRSSLNHVAFEMPDMESVMLGSGRLRDHGHEMEWGVGRHGPANNVFSYFIGPGDFVIEYTSDVDQIDDSYKVGTPADWKWPPGRIDRWGIHVGPSKRLHESEVKVGYPAELFRP
jgi:catechol 2,3-dioxygenase-like lactoylglutathione lyase family enzyme